jgi:zinc/manganese transport system substrate-binding protein
MFRRMFLHFLLLLTLTAACAPAAKTGSSTGNENGLRVLATETFLGDIAQNVAGDRLKVETLLPVTADPHEFQPRPQDAIKISNSQVLIVNGLGYETWLEKTLQGISGQRQVVVATDGMNPRPDPSGEHPDGDPHMWMNPLNVVHYVENIRDGLTKADPGGKDVYAANAEAYIAKLKDLDSWVRNEVNQLPVNKRLLVTNHDALGYFSQAYDFTVVGVVIPSVSDEAAPTAQQMATLINSIKSSGAPAIFLDISENQKLAQQIAAESGAKVVTDLYVETISAPDGPAPTHIEMIKHDVTEIVNALK